MTDNSLGPVIIDIEASTLTKEDEMLIAHPLVGGVILFSRNYKTARHLHALTKAIRAIKPLWICVDQEGGRVQRFKGEMTILPPFGAIGGLYKNDPALSQAVARASGWLMAMELRTLGVDFSFSPVLDRDINRNDVIGDRSFSDQVDTIIACGESYSQGLHDAGFPSIGKHYPGHGAVNLDSHMDLPVDDRTLNTILRTDGLPFQTLVEKGCLDGIMASHIVYEGADAHIAGASAFWLKDILRKQWGFSGVIFSDCLTMKAAAFLGSYPQRARACLAAGCDKILVCNNRPGAVSVLENLSQENMAPYLNAARDKTFLKQGSNVSSYPSLEALRETTEWRDAYNLLQEVNNDDTTT